MTTYVLVHGAWHGAWCWRKLTPLLEAAGHRVITPTLTGLGERAELLGPEVGLSTHVNDVADAIERADLHDVVLLGHSYGGMVITGAADRVPERIGHLVYLDTFVPRDGESMADVVPLVRIVFRREARRHGAGWKVDPPGEPPFGPRGLHGVTEEPDLSWVKRSQTPQSLRTFEEPLRLRDPEIVSRFPRTHILCTGRGRFVAVMRRIFGRTLPPGGPGWRLRRLPTGHDCMITMPRELADLLIEIRVVPSFAPAASRS